MVRWPAPRSHPRTLGACDISPYPHWLGNGGPLSGTEPSPHPSREMLAASPELERLSLIGMARHWSKAKSADFGDLVWGIAGGEAFRPTVTALELNYLLLNVQSSHHWIPYPPHLTDLKVIAFPNETWRVLQKSDIRIKLLDVVYFDDGVLEYLYTIL